MKPQTRFPVAVALSLLVLGIVLLAHWSQKQESLTVFPATMLRDCAPWDGAAFKISIPYDPISVITISIWRSPDFKFPTAFSLPEEEGQVGYASLLSELDPLIHLNGEVYFQSVREGTPIEGRFSLTSESGRTFAGRFIAEWSEQMALCG